MINMEVIPYGKQNITEEDIQAVVEALYSDYLTQGPKVKEFEECFARYIDCKYAVAVSNGTAALHLAAMALGVQKEDKVITTPITFVASANCIRYCGAEIVFSDIDKESYLLDISTLRNLLEVSPRGTYKGVIAVDFAGRAVNMRELRELADDYNLWIIEDACHSPGAHFTDNGRIQRCGDGKYADLAVFSFHPVKHIATGEGGMITTNNKDLYHKLLKLRTHGITRSDTEFLNSISFAEGVDNSTSTAYPGWYMEMQDLGYNYRITDFQAALGISQLKRADAGLLRRREIAKKYFEAFDKKYFIKGASGVTEGHAYHLYVIEVENRIGLYNFLREKGVASQIHYIPGHLMPYYKKQGWKEGDLPNAENYYKHCISLPMYPTLTDEEQDYVIETINSFYEL